MEWTDEIFSDELWGVLHEHMMNGAASEKQADDLVKLLGLGPGDAVLDAPCGNGRMTIPLAQRGLTMTGLDRSRPLLATAREKAATANLAIEWLEEDMRRLPADGRFDAVLNLWGSFGYFDDEGNRAFLEQSLRSLKPRGRLVIDAPTTESFFPQFTPRSFTKAGPVWYLADRVYEPLTGIDRVTFTLIHEDGRRSAVPCAIRVYGLAELNVLLRGVGFSNVQAYSAFGAEPASIGKRPMIVATR